MGFIYSDQNNWKEAEKYCRKSIELDPNNWIAINNLGICLNNNPSIQDKSEAIQCFKKVISSPNVDDEFKSNSFVILGIIYSKQNNLKEAEKYCRKSIGLDPNNWASISNLGNCLINNPSIQDKSEAIQCFKNVISNSTDTDLINLAKISLNEHNQNNN